MRSFSSYLRAPVLRHLFPAFAALSVVALGACGLSGSVDEVLQGEGEEATSGSPGSPTGSASTGSGGAGGGGGASTSNGVGGATGPEACLDGVDNNGDGMVDCADAACGDYECVDTAPDGWGGPYRVTTSTLPVPAPVQCDGGTAPETFFSEPAGPAECSACSCGDIQGASCSPAGITCWTGSTTCMGANTQDLTAALQNAQCNKPTNQVANTSQLSCSLTAPAAVAQNGSCAPSAVDFPNKAKFGNEVDACPLPTSGGGCGAGKACVPKGIDPTQSVCVRQDGAGKACPSGFSVTVQAYQDAVDSRGCADCVCGDAATACSGGGYLFHDLNQCMGNGGGDPPITINSVACDNVTPALDGQSTSFASWSIETTAAMPTGTCAPKGGEPTGQLNLQGPVTFCCK
jgi:hypothetical protein